MHVRITVVIKFAIVQLLSCVWLFVTPWTGAHQASLSFTVSRSLFKFMFTKLVMTSSRLILCHPSFPPVLNLFQDQGLFQWVGSSPQVAKNWNLSFSFSPSSEYSGLISVRTAWFDLFAVQGTLKSLLQHHSLKALILRHSIRKFLTSLWCLNRRVYFSLPPLCTGCWAESFLHWVRSLLPWGSAFFRCQGLPRSSEKGIVCKGSVRHTHTSTLPVERTPNARCLGLGHSVWTTPDRVGLGTCSLCVRVWCTSLSHTLFTHRPHKYRLFPPLFTIAP